MKDNFKRILAWIVVGAILAGSFLLPSAVFADRTVTIPNIMEQMETAAKVYLVSGTMLQCMRITYENKASQGRYVYDDNFEYDLPADSLATYYFNYNGNTTDVLTGAWLEYQVQDKIDNGTIWCHNNDGNIINVFANTLGLTTTEVFCNKDDPARQGIVVYKERMASGDNSIVATPSSGCNSHIGMSGAKYGWAKTGLGYVKKLYEDYVQRSGNPYLPSSADDLLMYTDSVRNYFEYLNDFRAKCSSEGVTGDLLAGENYFKPVKIFASDTYAVLEVYYKKGDNNDGTSWSNSFADGGKHTCGEVIDRLNELAPAVHEKLVSAKRNACETAGKIVVDEQKEKAQKVIDDENATEEQKDAARDYIRRVDGPWGPSGTAPMHGGIVGYTTYGGEVMQDGTIVYPPIRYWNNTAGDTNTQGVTCANVLTFDGENVIMEESDASTGNSTLNEIDICYSDSGSLGWIICPIITAASGIGEHMWDQIENYHLKIPASEVFESGGGVEQGWGIVRNIANTVFIILFLIVIFSQLTGVGIDNYGIKRILPKLIVVAVMVNLSYIICEVAVDLSNIFGVGLNNMLSGWAGELVTDAGAASAGGQVGAWALTLVLGGGGVLLFEVLQTGSFGGALAAIGLAVLGIVIVIVVAMLFLYLILVAREAGIVLSIIIAPVAIVCYALPNTEKFFKKWFDLFKALLLVYPICGAMVGAGQLAGSVLASIDNDGMKVAAAIVQVVPFFLVPMILKNSLSLMGNVGAKLSNWGRNIGRRGSGVLRQGVSNSERFKDWQQYRKDQAAAGRAQRVVNRLGSRDKLSARQQDRLAKATKTLNAQQERTAEAQVGVLPVDSEIAVQRAQSRRDAQELKAYQDQFAGFSQEQLRMEARAASGANGWLSRPGGTQRMSALISAMERNGMERDIYGMLKANDVSKNAGVMQSLTGSNNKILRAYGKRGAGVGFKEFMDGTGSSTLKDYVGEKGTDFLDGLDDKSLGEIRANSSSNNQIMSTDLLMQAAAKINSQDAVREIDGMLETRNDIKMSGEQLAQFNDSTLDVLLRRGANDSADPARDAIRESLLRASDDIARDSKLVGRVSAYGRQRLDAYRQSNGRSTLGGEQVFDVRGRVEQNIGGEAGADGVSE